MSNTDTTEINRLLAEVRRGSETAKAQLFERLYQLLKPVAHKALRRERSGHTMQTSDLLHQTLIRANLIDPAAKDWQNKSHLLGYAALTMRAILVDRGRQKARHPRVDWEEIGEIKMADQGAPEESNIFEAALQQLRALNPRAAKIVILRYYGDLTVDQIAEMLTLSRSTVNREWKSAKEFLSQCLDPSQLR